MVIQGKKIDLNMKDTIVAIATPTGNGGIAVIRISGSLSLEIAKKISHKKTFLERNIYYSNFYDSNDDLIDQGLVLYFKSPRSFTGEDIIELHTHGGLTVSQYLLQVCINYGARLAEPGEFSKRAFLNEKLNLVQVESIIDLINARSIEAVKASTKTLSGLFTQEINKILYNLIEIRSHIEVFLDFPDDIENIKSNLGLSLLNLRLEIFKLLKRTIQGNILNDGLRVVLSGIPNAGKSSLLNCLLKEERAIVDPTPGTTRDIIRENIVISGIPITLVDTAGIRNSINNIENEGIRRAHDEINKADIIFWLVDSTMDVKNLIKNGINSKENSNLIFTKIDLLSREYINYLRSKYPHALFISVKTGEGINDLYIKIRNYLGKNNILGNVFIARKRHVSSMRDSFKYISSAINNFNYKNWELLAEDLYLLSLCLENILGISDINEKVLDSIFSNFCIGK